MDIIGAAETGSGKTLAFGIPIIHGILTDKQEEAECMPVEGTDSGLEESEEEAESGDAGQKDGCPESDSDNEETPAEEDIYGSDESEFDDDNDANVLDTEGMSKTLGCVKVIDNADFSFMEEGDQKTTTNPSKKLRALIVTPTRELAIQVNCEMLT